MYTLKQQQLVNDIMELIEIENVTDDNTIISIRVPEDFVLKISKSALDITFMFNVEDLHNITYNLSIEEAIRNIAITVIYFFGNPFPSCVEDVLWYVFMDTTVNS